MDDMQQVFESVARYFSVLGEPTRLRILHALCQQERCVNDILRATGLAQANVSRHLGLMYQAGMLSRRREGTQVFYRVADPVYVELCGSVLRQVQGRLDSLGGSDAPSETPSGAFSVTRPPVPPANQKEEASV